MHESIRILIADDHPIVRQGLQLVLSMQADMELVGEASNGEEAVQQALEQRPDVVVMDLQMPVKDGVTAITEIFQKLPGTRVLVLTSFDDESSVFGAVRAGALGFVLKDSTPEQLLQVIRTVYLGEAMLHSSIARKVLRGLQRQVPQQSPDLPLTEREVVVLRCLAQGLSNRDIATEIGVSVRTVTTHVRNILDKLHLANRTQAALYARECGIHPTDFRQ